MAWEEKLQILLPSEMGLAVLILGTASRQKQAVSSHPPVPGTACLQGTAGSTHGDGWHDLGQSCLNELVAITASRVGQGYD